MKPIHLVYDGLRPVVEEAVMKTNDLLCNDAFYEQIIKHNNFDDADISPAEIADLIRHADINIEVDLYYALNPSKNIDGFLNHDGSNRIYLNIWTLERPVESICNTMVHHCVHAVNSIHNHFYFGHSNGPSAGREHTAPYKIGSIAQMMLSKSDTHHEIVMEHDTIMPGRMVIKDYLAAFK